MCEGRSEEADLRLQIHACIGRNSAAIMEIAAPSAMKALEDLALEHARQALEKHWHL